MVPLLAPETKHSGGSRPSLRVATPCYARFSRRHRDFVLKPKPPDLKHFARIDQKAHRQYQNHLERIAPLDRAEFYMRQMEIRGVMSPWVLEKLLDEPFSRVWRSSKLLRLPLPIRRLLRDHRKPEVIRYFTERKLLGLLRLGESRAIWRRFLEMVGEADREAGIWNVGERSEDPMP